MAAAVGFGQTWAATEADVLRWDAEKQRIHANVPSGDLQKILARLSTLTGWEVFLEPGSNRRVSAQFRDRPAGEGLRLLLGDLNFALVPRTNGPSRLYIYRTDLAEATHRVAQEERKPGTLIPNELIVTLNTNSTANIDELARALDAKVVGVAKGLNAYRLEFKDEDAADAARAKLEKDATIGQIDSNYEWTQPKASPETGRANLAAFGLKPKAGDAKNVIIGLLDTPVQNLDSRMEAFLLPSIHVAGEPGPPPEAISHGTSMAETILHALEETSTDPSGSTVRILPVDVYGSRGETTTFEIANGIYAALNSGATVINLSLGGDGDSRLLRQVIQQGSANGVLFFGSAGNLPTTRPTYPAAYPEVIAVTAGDSRGNIAPYANRGEFVDAIGPGASFIDVKGQTYIVTGTSPASAALSGVAGGLRGLGVSPEQTRQEILRWFGVPRGTP